MNALPPLPDHRAEVLIALADLNAIKTDCTGVTFAEIETRTGLRPGEAWLACHQLQWIGLVAATGTVLTPSLWSLTPEGVALIPHLKGEGQ